MQRPGGQGTAFSIDSLIGTPQPRPGHLLYTGYPMFMPYRPLVIPQALSHSPLSSGIPPLAPLASFAGRLTNTFCASLGQGVPSMVALTTTMPSFSDPPDSFYPPQELPGPRLSAADPGARRQESPHSEELHSRDKGSELLNFSETFQTISGKLSLITYLYCLDRVQIPGLMRKEHCVKFGKDESASDCDRRWSPRYSIISKRKKLTRFKRVLSIV